MTARMMLAVALAACHVPDRQQGDPDDKSDAATGDTGDWVTPDAPPPSVDAGPDPDIACNKQGGNPHVDAGTGCELPPSKCLDQWYLIYYTSASCVDGKCEYVRELLYCANWGCINGGCNPGFT